MSAIGDAVAELTELGVRVLSPSDPRVVDNRGEFLFVASDRVRSVRLVQDRHLESIRASSFLWLVAPDGYVGQSASMELGFAVGSDVPVLGLHRPSDLTLRQYVRTVPYLRRAVATMQQVAASEPQTLDRLLIDPYHSIEEAHQILDRMRGRFSESPTRIDDQTAEHIVRERDALTEILSSVSKRSVNR